MTKQSGKGDRPTPEDIDWLIDGRDINQRNNAELLQLLKKHSRKLKKNKELLGVAHLLVGASFSLWRAVFLADVAHSQQGYNFEKAHKEAINFLEQVITNNAIAYPQDRAARDWTFGYHLNNACYRLLAIRNQKLGFLEDSKFLKKVASEGTPPACPKYWDNCQCEAGKAIESLKQILEGKSPKRIPKS